MSWPFLPQHPSIYGYFYALGINSPLGKYTEFVSLFLKDINHKALYKGENVSTKVRVFPVGSFAIDVIRRLRRKLRPFLQRLIYGCNGTICFSARLLVAAVPLAYLSVLDSFVVVQKNEKIQALQIATESRCFIANIIPILSL